MSIRNATIAMRKRKIGLSKQEDSMAHRQSRHRADAAGHGARKRHLPPLERSGKAPYRQGSWADW
jgi:hypothetical protein